MFSEGVGGHAPRWDVLAPDLDRAPDPPDYVVDGLLARDAVTILSGDTGSAKSMIAMALVAAALRRDSWLGRPVAAHRPVVVDEENPPHEVWRRMRAFGIRNEHLGALRYFNREGILLDYAANVNRLANVLRKHDADLLIIDTLAATTGFDTNDNAAAVAFYRETLRPLSKLAAVLILHHERKHQNGQRGNGGQAMMGARQLAGQADTHLSVHANGSTVAREPQPNGHTLERYPITLEWPKSRDGAGATDLALCLESETDAERRKLWMALRVVGDAFSGSAEEALLHQLLDALARHERLSRADLARYTGREPRGSLLERALKRGIDTGLIARPQRGVYTLARP
jgi:hypothetical protein